MPRLFLLGVGGTGVRVTKALLHAMGAGVKPNTREQWTIVPILIDPHQQNKDLLRTKQLLRDYVALQHAAESARPASGVGGFFPVKVEALGQIDDEGAQKDAGASALLADIGAKRFREYIGLSTYQDPARTALAHALFDDHQLDVSMEIGFVGNPGIGVVALDDLRNQPELKAMASAFSAGDRIFIASSIFGGSGAAAFPVLVKLFRNPNALGANGVAISTATIGALSVQPYFRVAQDSESRIRNIEFVERAKEALRYYERVLPGKIQAFYTLGENSTAEIPNDPGDVDNQQNPAHYVELAGALAIVDFLEKAFDVQGPTKEFEFAMAEESEVFSLKSFAEADQRRIVRPFANMYALSRYVTEHLDADLSREVYGKTFAPGFGNSRTVRALLGFAASYRSWIREMQGTNRSFRPYTPEAEDYAGAIVNFPPEKRILLGSKKLNHKDLKEAFNKLSPKRAESLPHDDARLLAILGEGVADSIESTIPLV